MYSSQKDSTRPSNPFQCNSINEDSLLDVAMEILQTVTCRKGPSNFISDIEFTTNTSFNFYNLSINIKE